MSLFRFIRDLAKDETGVGVIEVVLILVVLIGLVTVFRNQINIILTNIFSSITTLTEEII